MYVAGVQFVSGRADVTLSDSDFEGVARYLGRCYGVVEELADGICQDHADWPARPVSAVHSEVQEDRRPAPEAPVRSERHADPPPGPEGSVPEGGRSKGPDPERLRKAIEELDPADPECWTGGGEPRVDAVSDRYGAPVTRSDIERVTT